MKKKKARKTKHGDFKESKKAVICKLRRLLSMKQRKRSPKKFDVNFFHTPKISILSYLWFALFLFPMQIR